MSFFFFFLNELTWNFSRLYKFSPSLSVMQTNKNPHNLFFFKNIYFLLHLVISTEVFSIRHTCLWVFVMEECHCPMGDKRKKQHSAEGWYYTEMMVASLWEALSFLLD